MVKTTKRYYVMSMTTVYTGEFRADKKFISNQKTCVLSIFRVDVGDETTNNLRRKLNMDVDENLIMYVII